MSVKSLLKGSRTIVRITPDHYPQIHSWHEARGRRIDIEGNISDMGYLVDGRVAGWLYVTNSNAAFIEGLVADPNSVPSLRRASMRKLTGFLIDTAVMLGYTHIFAITRHPSVVKMAHEFGAKENSSLKVFTISTERD